MPVWVVELDISPAVEAKINAIHQISAPEVREAILTTPGLSVVHQPPKATIRVTIRNRLCYVVIYEVDDPLGDHWRLATAYPVR